MADQGCFSTGKRLGLGGKQSAESNCWGRENSWHLEEAFEASHMRTGTPRKSTLEQIALGNLCLLVPLCLAIAFD